MNWLIIVLVFNSFALGALLSWDSAHKDIASECKKLGAFYVGDDVFRCTKITKYGEEDDK